MVLLRLLAQAPRRRASIQVLDAGGMVGRRDGALYAAGGFQGRVQAGDGDLLAMIARCVVGGRDDLTGTHVQVVGLMVPPLGHPVGGDAVPLLLEQGDLVSRGRQGGQDAVETAAGPRVRHSVVSQSVDKSVEENEEGSSRWVYLRIPTVGKRVA